jgi:hypothetical protein
VQLVALSSRPDPVGQRLGRGSVGCLDLAGVKKIILPMHSQDQHLALLTPGDDLPIDAVSST